jgi:hypothetical protein
MGFDRLLEYGLKYPTAFKHNHLGVVVRGTLEHNAGMARWDDKRR